MTPVLQHPLALDPGVGDRGSGCGEHDRREEPVVRGADERRVPEVHRAEVRRATRGEPSHVESEAPCPTVGADVEQGAGERVRALAGRREDQAALLCEPQIALERAELGEGSDLALSVGPDAERRSGGGQRVGGEDAVSEIALGERACADLRAAEEWDLVRRLCRKQGQAAAMKIILRNLITLRNLWPHCLSPALGSNRIAFIVRAGRPRAG